MPKTERNSPGTSNFKDFEHHGWQTVAGSYHDHFSSLTKQTIEPMLDAVKARPNVDLLDVATGPGYVAGRAKDRGCRVTAVDFSAVMVERARQLYDGIIFEEGDAESLSYTDNSFDAVTMNFGLLHLARPEQALAEAFRVLKAGGKFAFTVWAKPEHALAFGIVLKAVEKFGDMSVTIPEGPPFFRFSNEGESRRALIDAGFKNVEIAQLPLTWKLKSGDDFFAAFYLGTPRTGGLLRAQAPDALNAVKQAVLKDVAQYRDGDLIKIPMAAVLASGTK